MGSPQSLPFSRLNIPRSLSLESFQKLSFYLRNLCINTPMFSVTSVKELDLHEITHVFYLCLSRVYNYTTGFINNILNVGRRSLWQYVKLFVEFVPRKGWSYIPLEVFVGQMMALQFRWRNWQVLFLPELWLYLTAKRDKQRCFIFLF